MNIDQLMQALGLQRAYQAYQQNIGEPFAAIAGGMGRGYLGLDKPQYGGLLAEDMYRAGQAMGNMPALGAPAGAFKAAAQIPGLLEAAGIAPAIFIGPKAKLWNKASAEAFEKLEKSGVSNKDAYLETGTFRSPDGKLRQEISDFPSEYLPGKEFARQTDEYINRLDEAFAANYLRQTMDRLGVGIADAKDQFREMFGKDVPATAGSLAKALTSQEASDLYKRLEAIPAPSREKMQTVVGNVYSHPELFKSYPELFQTQFNIKSPEDMGVNFQGLYDGGVSFRNDVGYAMQSGKSLMAHELQHAIQNLEGFGVGGTPRSAADFVGEMIIKNQDRIRQIENIPEYAAARALDENLGWQAIEGKIPFEVYEKQIKSHPGYGLLQEYGKLREFLRTKPVDGDEAYRRLAGEAEARAVQARMNYPQEELRKMFPLESYDVPIDQLIIRGLLSQ